MLDIRDALIQGVFMLIELEPQTRTEGIGASDAAGILGLDDWNPPIRVWRRLRGELLFDISGEAAEWGQILEPVVLGRYAVKTRSIVVQPTTSIVHPRHPWLHATPDGGVMDGTVPTVCSGRFSDHAIDGLVQAKTASAYLAHEWADGKAPRKYVVQVQVEMACTGAPWCDLADGRRRDVEGTAYAVDPNASLLLVAEHLRDRRSRFRADRLGQPRARSSKLSKTRDHSSLPGGCHLTPRTLLVRGLMPFVAHAWASVPLRLVHSFCSPFLTSLHIC